MRAIDADALTQLLRTCADDKWNKDTSAGSWSNAYEEMILHVEDMPTIEPERTGRWIDIDSETYTWKVRCDQCGHERSMMSTQGRYPKFCEGCGAKMEVEHAEI